MSHHSMHFFSCFKTVLHVIYKNVFPISALFLIPLCNWIYIHTNHFPVFILRILWHVANSIHKNSIDTKLQFNYIYIYIYNTENVIHKLLHIKWWELTCTIYTFVSNIQLLTMITFSFWYSYHGLVWFFS